MKNIRTYQVLSNQAFPELKTEESDGNDFGPVLPPWASSVSWFEANQSLDYLIQLHRNELEQAMMLAGSIQFYLGSLFSLMDELCATTCFFCPDPCCLDAKIWIDFRDLLFLHLSNQQIPPGQTVQNLKQTCRYWNLGGCTLPRILRPWVCTWYLCPVQMANFRRKTHAVQKNFNRMIQAVKMDRKEMETEFIRATTLKEVSNI